MLQTTVHGIGEIMVGLTRHQEATKDLLGPLNAFEKKYAPTMLFYCGDKNILMTPKVAIIGTRNPSSAGVNATTQIVSFLVEKKVTIVSGLAKGIDTVAHKTAIDNQGKTIAVLGTPLDVTYPAENKTLQHTIMSKHLAISQFPSGSAVQKQNFPLRNRTMALIAHASIIVEAGKTSGTIHQGWEALRLGRPLFIMEELVHNTALEWPQKLLEYGAHVLSLSNLQPLLDEIPSTTLVIGHGRCV